MGITVRSGVTIIDSGIPTGGTTGQALIKASGQDYDVTWGAGGGGSGSPAGSDTQIQYNNAGAFGASGNFTWNNSTSAVSVTGSCILNAGTASTLALTIKGASSQTANLLEWQLSDGTRVAAFGADGTLYGNGNDLKVGGHSNALYGSWCRYDLYGLRAYGMDVPYPSSDFVLVANTRESLRISQNGAVIINNFTAATVGLTLKGAASQTANLFEAQKSDGTGLVTIGPTGQITINKSGSNGLIINNSSGNALAVFNASSASITDNSYLTIQTAGTDRWYIGQSVSSLTGNFEIYGTGFAGAMLTLNRTTGLITTNSSVINCTTSSSIGLTIKGAASQTANLLEVQNNSATLVANITPTGIINSQVEFRLNNTTYSRVGQAGASGDWLGGYNININGGAVNRDSTGFVSGIHYNIGTLDFYSLASGSAGAISPQMQLTSTALSLTDHTINTYGRAVISRSGDQLRFGDASGWDSTNLMAGGVQCIVLEKTGTNVFISASGASVKPLAVRAVASQTANLTEWQDNSGTVQLAIAANGRDLVLDTTTGTKIGTSTTQKLGFWNAAPVVQSTGWGATNVTTDKSFDANATTLDELADVLGSLIEQLKSYGLLGA